MTESMSTDELEAFRQLLVKRVVSFAQTHKLTDIQVEALCLELIGVTREKSAAMACISKSTATNRVETLCIKTRVSPPRKLSAVILGLGETTYPSFHAAVRARIAELKTVSTPTVKENDNA